MLTTTYKSFFNKLFEPGAKAIARTGVHPTVITWSGVFLAAAACLWLLKTRDLLHFCLLLLIVGLADVMDGAVARASGRVSKCGAYADAMADRYVEIGVMGTVAYVTGTWVLSFAFLSGSLLMSYAKARTAVEVPVLNQEWPDLAERTERLVLYWFGLLFSQLFSVHLLGRDIFWWTLFFGSVGIHISVIQRMFRAHRMIAERG